MNTIFVTGATGLPREASTRFDAVPDDYVNGAIAWLALGEHVVGQTLPLCSGDRALPLGEMLDITYGIWVTVPAWRRRGLGRPAPAARTYWAAAVRAAA